MRRGMQPGAPAAAMLAAVAFVASLAAATGCGRPGAAGAGREEVTSLLRKEAESLKSDGEKLDPVLRVKATWTIAGIDVTERPGDADRPWAGTIRFKIRSEMRDEQGSVTADEFERRFDYAYAASLKRWIFQMPSSPAP